MENTSILDSTKKFLDEASLDGSNLDTKVLNLLRQEYLRQLGQYRRIDLLMQQKYRVTFDEFVSRRVVRRQEYSWNVESDAMECETAISGIKTIEHKLEDLKKEACVLLQFSWRRTILLKSCGWAFARIESFLCVVKKAVECRFSESLN